MRTLKTKLFLIATIFYSLFICNIWAQNITEIDFYGIASKDAEKNMLSMTEDLFLAQLKELNYTIVDKRYENFSSDYFSSSYDFSASNKQGIAVVYMVISKLESGKWQMQTNFLEYNSKNPKSTTQVYDSYYKILMESKTSLSKNLSELVSNSTSVTTTNKSVSENKPSLTLDDLAGSWYGEKYINKIIIMRGGRGFVIFKNGASMNIFVKIETSDKNQVVSVIQTSGNNASYFPEIERQKALEVAMNAEPISWNFRAYGTNTLKGTVKTLTADANGNISEGTLPSEWKKIIQ